MNALILAIAALVFSRLVTSDRIEPYRDQVIQWLEKTTDRLPNSIRLPVMVGGAVTLGAIVAFLPLIGPIVTFAALIVVFRFGRITEDARAVLTELRNGSFSQAQIQLSAFSNTDASQLDENGVARITIETQIQKLADDVFSPLAWFALGGLPGLLLYWTSGCDRPPRGFWRDLRALATVTQLGAHSFDGADIGLMGDREKSRAIWTHQAKEFSDPEAGILVAATAGALRIKLGGSRCVQGLIRQEPVIGDGDEAARYHIEETQSLIDRSLLLWGVAALVIIAL